MKKHRTRFPGYYITEDGKIFREPTKYDNTHKLVEVGQHPRGGINPDDRYMSVNISLKDEKGKTLKQIKYYTHRLIAETLIENPKNLSEVDHINRDKKNNCVENLRWVSRKENWICPEHGEDGKWLKLKNFPEVRTNS